MKKIVLLRHGESLWNMENRFTGWTDVDLTAKGEAEAYTAGEQLLADDFHFDKAYTSYLKDGPEIRRRAGAYLAPQLRYRAGAAG